MEPVDVLKRFLDVCANKDDKCTRYSFASNGILEWFGRNIKDNNKIFEYIRYNISHQYEHIFSVAIRCDPFEEKPLHKATRQQVTHAASTVVGSNSEDIFETPPGSSSASKESDDMATPEKKIGFNVRDEKSDFSDTDERQKSSPQSPRITRSSRKRSTEPPHPKSPSKRNKRNGQKESEQLNTQTAADEQSDLKANRQPVDDVGEIKYIEAVGTIRKLRKLKHRGIDSRAKDIRIYESPTRKHWDAGNTKLKISYRENLHRSDLQFVLVIYQHIENNPRCKRDLMTEFSKTCPDEPSSETQKSEKKCKSIKSSKMRRLRF